MEVEELVKAKLGWLVGLFDLVAKPEAKRSMECVPHCAELPVKSAYSLNNCSDTSAQSTGRG